VELDKSKGGSKVEERSPRSPKVEGSNPDTVAGKRRDR
jgi:hypothetical protein